MVRLLTLKKSVCGRQAVCLYLPLLTFLGLLLYLVFTSYFPLSSISVWLFSGVQGCWPNSDAGWSVWKGGQHTSQSDAKGIVPYDKIWFTDHQETLTKLSKHEIYSSLNNWIVTVVCHLYSRDQVLLKCVELFLYPSHAASSRWQLKWHLQFKP